MTFPVEPLPPSYLPPRVPALLRRGSVRQRHRARASGDGAGLLETEAKRSPTEGEGEGEGEELRQEGEGPPHLGLRRALLSKGRGALAVGGRWRGPPQLLPPPSPAHGEPTRIRQRSAPRLNPHTGYLALRWGAPPFHRRVRQARCARVLGGRKLCQSATVESCSARRTGRFGSSPDSPCEPYPAAATLLLLERRWAPFYSLTELPRTFPPSLWKSGARSDREVMKEELGTRVFRRCCQRARKDNVAGVRPVPLCFWTGACAGGSLVFSVASIRARNPQLQARPPTMRLMLPQLSSARFLTRRGSHTETEFF